jgi:hypothetical protein
MEMASEMAGFLQGSTHGGVHGVHGVHGDAHNWQHD